MEYLIIALIVMISTLLIKFVFGVNVKKLKKFIENEKLDKLVSKFPSNIEVCKSILKKLNNEDLKIEETENEASFYMIVGNKIQIGKIGHSYTRIQTIAHECIHSIQSKRMLWFHWIISNIFLIYSVIVIVLRFGKVEFFVNNQNIFFAILVAIGFIFYAVRTYIENDAMIKAKNIAKEYMEEEKLASKEEIKELVDEYEMLNNLGIPCVNYNILLMISIAIFAFSIICFVR